MYSIILPENSYSYENSRVAEMEPLRNKFSKFIGNISNKMSKIKQKKVESDSEETAVVENSNNEGDIVESITAGQNEDENNKDVEKETKEDTTETTQFSTIEAPGNFII
jgi:hypothetical protein